MRTLLIAAVLLLASFTVLPAGEPVCAPLRQLHDILEADFGETPRAHQLTSEGHVLTAFVNSTTGSWTIVAHDMRQGCVIQHGDADTLPESLKLLLYGDTI